MFYPETEDMLPRMAPTPCADVPQSANEAIPKPQVPEVSILFGQQAVNVQQQQQLLSQNNAKSTYAAWKNKMLPKVAFHSPIDSCSEMQFKENINIQDHNCPRANLYPFRSVANSGAITATTAVQSFGGGVALANNPIIYRCNLENSNEHMNYHQQIQQLPSLPQTFTPPQCSRDVLTICAGTQTDKNLDFSSSSNVPWSNLATKKDVSDVFLLLGEMKKEQQQILKILEALILNPDIQGLSKPQTCDVAVQIGNIANDNHPFNNGAASLAQEKGGLQAAPKNKFIQHLKPASSITQTPKGKPIVHSTAYSPNSPQTQRLQENVQEVSALPSHQHTSNKPPTIVPNTGSDTSLAMKELALKYLPNEKLAELLMELNMDCPLETASAIANIPKTPANKFEKGPSDVSNASYKYLKKYRLLAEDHDDNDNANDDFENENQIPSHNSPQYNVRHASANQRQTPTNKNSPYSGRLPLSPLARPSSPLSAVSTQFVNLENIKHQPKFL